MRIHLWTSYSFCGIFCSFAGFLWFWGFVVVVVGFVFWVCLSCFQDGHKQRGVCWFHTPFLLYLFIYTHIICAWFCLLGLELQQEQGFVTQKQNTKKTPKTNKEPPPTPPKKIQNHPETPKVTTTAKTKTKTKKNRKKSSQQTKKPHQNQ